MWLPRQRGQIWLSHLWLWQTDNIESRRSRRSQSRHLKGNTSPLRHNFESYKSPRYFAQSETSGFTIPEIDLVLHPGTLGGRFTTLEGILEQVYEELSEKVFAGDSTNVGSEEYTTFEAFLKGLKEVWFLAAYGHWGTLIDVTRLKMQSGLSRWSWMIL